MFRIYILSLAFLFVFVKCVAEIENKYSENFISSEGFWKDDALHDPIINSETPLYLPIRTVDKEVTSRLDVGGIIGSLGLKKGASVLGLIIFPLLFPFFLLFGFILFFLFLFVSIGAASGTAVTTGRHITNMVHAEDDSNSVYQNIFDSDDECIEKLSCEIMKRLKTNKSKELLMGILEKLTSNDELMKRISLAAYKTEDCINYYSCDWRNILVRTFMKE